MHFDRLRLVGFKSFVDPTELRIGPGLTGVVGPNGCGKSNLLEGFRWVMGEGSAKSLRGGGMDDVIFAGTAARPGRDFAEVKLTLTDAAGAIPGGDDTLEVVRRIERGLGSAYRINGRDVRARDAQLLFADAATGAHSPALVSQGRIGAIIAARPAERRALLEEAAGIAGLHVRRHEAELRLKATEANLGRLDDMVAQQTTAAAALRRAAKAAERYRAVSAALDDAEKALLVARWTAAAAAAQAADAAARAADAGVADATRAAARLATAQAESAAALPDLRTVEAAAAAALQRIVEAQRARVAEAAAVAARQRDLAAMMATIERDRAREDGLARDAAAAAERLAAEAERLAAMLAAAKPALAAADRAVPVAETDAAAKEAALAEAIEAHARAAALARAAAAALETAAARQLRAAAEADRLAAVAAPDVTNLDARHDDAAAMVAAATAAVAAATDAIAAADAARRSADAARDAAATARTAARAHAAGLAAERDALTRRLATGGGTSLLDRITVAPGDELAFAAAFGDDLSAALEGENGSLAEPPAGRGGFGVPRTGARGHDEGDRAAAHGRAAAGAPATRWWATSDGPLPPLPAGCEPLRAHVPPQLERRLAATGVAEPADAPALAAQILPGQRLVTRDGRLWRWDGFRDYAAGGGQGAAAADRLTARNRLAALDADLPEAGAAVSAAESAAAAAAADLAAANDADRAGRAARAAAERDLDAARTAVAATAAERDRAAARTEATAAAIARLRDDAAAFAREADAARTAAAEVTGVADLAAAATTARGAAEASRAALAAARAAAATLVRDRDAATARAAAVAGERRDWDRRAGATATHLADLAARADAAAAEASALADRPAAIAAEQADLASRESEAAAARRVAADALAAAEAGMAAIDRDARATAAALGDAREARARAAADADHHVARRREIEAACGARFGTSPPRLRPADATGAGDPDALAAAVARLTGERERIGPVNLRADLELAELDATIAVTAAERAELDTAVARLRGSIGSLNREGRARLLAAFDTVNRHFRDLFATLFTGGAAHLALVESDDPLAAGLEIMAQPPGKKLASLTLLSGGEQALTATALIFALFLTTPSPLCVLDEVDAPLDDANVERFCDLLDRMAERTATRFLIVTHNAVTMSRMHRLYGVTMAEAGVSQLVSVDLGGAERLLAAE